MAVWSTVIIPCTHYFVESGPNAASHKEVMKLRKENQGLTEENNFLKLKVDILLDMVIKTVSS